jgi:cytosine/adenosine deaminase-related metal-dependent hydrolase
VGLDDRGVIEPGRRADLVVVDDTAPDLPCAVLTLPQDAPVFSAGDFMG